MHYRTLLLGFWLGTALAGGVALAAEPATPAAECCTLRVTWHPYEQAYFTDPERSLAARRTRLRFERAFTAVAKRWQQEGICIDWAAGSEIEVTAGLRLFGATDPSAESLEARIDDASAPALLFVERLEARDPDTGSYLRKRGVTLRPGGKLAVIALDDRRTLPTVIDNELLHLLGLRDDELGATLEDARHTVTPPMWKFLRRTCGKIGDRKALAAIVAEKDACMKASGDDKDGAKREACFAPQPPAPKAPVKKEVAPGSDGSKGVVPPASNR